MTCFPLSALQLALERKQGVSNLELMCRELLEEEQAKEQRLQHKRQKRRKKKNKSKAETTDMEPEKEKENCEVRCTYFERWLMG